MDHATLSGISQLIARLPAVAAVRPAEVHVRIAGLLSAAKPAVTAALASSQPLLVVTAHPHTAQELVEELIHWTDDRIALFPASEALPYERVRVDRTVLAGREAAAAGLRGGEIGIVVAPARALLQPFAAGDVADSAQQLAVGDTIALDRLLAGWIETGYQELPTVEEVGTFARRGGVVDIFPAAAERPIRIELFGHEIESLREFDPVTQRSIGPVPLLTIQPIARMDETARVQALEALIDVDTSTLHAEAQTRWMDDLARLEAGAALDELAVFAPYLLAGATSLVDHLPPTTRIVIDTVQETWQVLDDLWQQGLDVQRSLEEAGGLPPNLKPALIEPGQIRCSLENRHTVEWLTGSEVGAGTHDWTNLFVAAHTYAGRLRSLAHDLAAAPGRVVVATRQAERIAELLREDEIPARQVRRLETPPELGVTVVPAGIGEGWTLPAERLTLLSDHELFGRARTRPVPRRTRPPREAFFTDFTPGDYVVHLEHGIGRFEAVTRMTIDGAEREYALVQYAGTDRLYVPTDQLDRLTRYVGVGETPPQLNKLGGGEWQRVRQRAKQAAAEIAHELIDLYAKRMARPGHGFAADTPWQAELESSFPFEETPDQLRAVAEVKSDMEVPRPMDRLICADVGYGKTEVAVRAAFKALMDGKQIAILVPTTILAQQHFDTFSERLRAFPVRVEVLSRFRSRTEQQQILRRLAAGEVDVLIGTHRLLGKDVVFKDLGLLIVDEEQRFGVRHKERLRKLRESIDTLTLTATPIPRTLHMGLVGIREISVIETPPEGRLPIMTYLQPFDERLVREAVLRELDRDGQVYIIHNKVATIEAMAERIRRLVPEARVVVGHGQMEDAHLERVMLTFARGEADVLVSSTIIENGVDIPNVNTLIINNAQALGLTQLYQLRGRVGRSANQAYAYLLYPRDGHPTVEAMRRMEAIFEAQDLGAGFTIAMKDLEIRGAGNLLGAEQSGHATAIGFDLYTRMVSDAVEQLRGVPVEEPAVVTIDLPLTMFLPKEYVGNEAERLTLYRRLAAVTAQDGLAALTEELRDRFGPPPPPVENLLTSVRLKLLALEAHVQRVSLTAEVLSLRTEPTGIYDRVSLYRRYGADAKISTNVLRIPRRLLGSDWVAEVETILTDMVRLRTSLGRPAPTAAPTAS